MGTGASIPGSAEEARFIGIPEEQISTYLKEHPPKVAPAPRVVVYLGASAPVHITHMKLARAMLDEGFDKIFLFLLTWSPDRAGISADSGAKQLRKWLAALSMAERSRIDLQVVHGEAEGAAKMRSALGPDVDPEVDVCFSQKYSDQLERIKSNWMPLYLKEFPKAKPRFLTNETDPGAKDFGTPMFTNAVAAFKAARGTPGALAANDALSKWRPKVETPLGWLTYINGLLTGANGDPFYAPAELATLQQRFFSDADVLTTIKCGQHRPTKIPGTPAEYLKDPGNQRRFWKKMSLPSDHALFKQFCLRAQGLVPASALALMPAVTALPAGLHSGKPYAVLASEAMHSTATRLVACDPTRFEYHMSKWRTFPDGTDDITLGGFRKGEDKVTGRDVIFLASFHSNSATMSQLHALQFLCESCFLSSLTILLAFMPTATMERYLQAGRIPTGNTLAKLISSLPATGGKKTRVMIYDVHSPPTQYFFTGSTTMTMHTACPLIIEKISQMASGDAIDCIAFPDDGAAKRFSKFFKKHLKNVEVVICNKVRTKGNKRQVVVSDGDPSGKRVLVMDDLIQTGGTLYECGVTLVAAGAKSVSGFVVHAVFPKQSWKRFLKGGDRSIFEKFYLSSSNPSVCSQIPGGGVFEVLDLTPRIVHDLEHEPSGRSAWW